MSVHEDPHQHGVLVSLATASWPGVAWALAGRRRRGAPLRGLRDVRLLTVSVSR